MRVRKSLRHGLLSKGGDVFTYASKFRKVADIKDGQWTKRNICSASAAIFDPLGLILHFIGRARVIMQEIWKQKLNWDEHSVSLDGMVRTSI